jgi:hypothetical protein
MIIALSGAKRSGKDSASDVLCKDFNFERISLADPIRELCAKVFKIPISTFTSDDLKEKSFDVPLKLELYHIAEIIDIVSKVWEFDISIEARNSMYNNKNTLLKHPRHILQTVGTEIIRNNVDKDIFLKLADKRIEKIDKNVVITDCRFSNEREHFKAIGATLCLIKRPSKHHIDMHMSENDLGTEADYDVVMNNDDSLSRFQIDIGFWADARLKRRSY